MTVPEISAKNAGLLRWCTFARGTCMAPDRLVSYEKNVRRLQVRIAKATQEGRWGKVKALQRLLTRSFHSKMLAVKRVTENRGKRTPGIDGKIWSTPAAKSKGSLTLKNAAINRNR